MDAKGQTEVQILLAFVILGCTHNTLPIDTVINDLLNISMVTKMIFLHLHGFAHMFSISGLVEMDKDFTR